MGDKVSIQFVKGDQKSVVLFSQWGGMDMVDLAKDYVSLLRREIMRGDNAMQYPLTRLEPDTVIVDFIRSITAHQDRVTSDLYLRATQEDGDNSDNGHHEINLEAET
jgi:hypothetical protein